MTHLKISFSNPWLLFLLIPAIALTLWPYFRLAKQYRRNRNRIISVVLHMIVMVLCITLLSGISFGYELPNKENEILLLVDASFSSRDAEERKESFIEEVINDCGSNYRVGVVKFGFTQVYAAPLSNDSSEVYKTYLSSDEPDTSATDIAAALRYASGLFKKPETAKIVLLSDGVETDGNANSVIRGISSEGIRVDVVSLSSIEHDEVQIIGVETPDRNIAVGDTVKLGLTLQSNVGGTGHEVIITLTDTVYGEEETVKKEPVTITQSLVKGVQTAEIEYTFDSEGMHELYFQIQHKSETGDTVVQNNTYFSYLKMQVFDKVLIVEKNRGESNRIETLLTSDEFQYEVTTVCATDRDQIPTTVEQLCDYEQVVLVNIANKDVTDEFFEALNVYVSDLGGGLFTVGGDNDLNSSGDIVPHAYNRDDMLGTLYQQMLPVRAVNYTPPVAVMIVIDNSGSMGSGDTGLVSLAKNGALACVDALTSRDYCGVMTFSDSQKEEIDITPLSRRDEVVAAIRRIPEEGGGGTVFEGVIDRAGSALAALDVSRKHIIMVSDGVVDDKDVERYMKIVKDNAKKGITLSVVGLRVYGAYIQLMQDTCDAGGGTFYNVQSSGNVAATMFQDLMNNAIEEIQYGKEFTLRIAEHTDEVSGITQPELDELPFTGYYGTSLKNGAWAPLIGEHVPIYAQWEYGNGNVGSFMCDLGDGEKSWSKGFLESAVGKRFIKNVFTGLFPTEEISLSDIEVSFKDDNYTTQMNVYTPVGETDTVSVTVTPQTEVARQFYAETPVQVAASDGNTRFTFVITCPGLYEVTVQKKNAEGAVLSERTIHRTFSYSEEYNTFPEEEAPTGEEFLAALAENGKGKVVTDSLEVFDTFEKTVKRTADPRLAFLIIAIVLFLLDIAVRKFKFKWIHELIRDHKARKEIQHSHKN